MARIVHIELSSGLETRITSKTVDVVGEDFGFHRISFSLEDFRSIASVNRGLRLLRWVGVEDWIFFAR